MSNKGSIHLPMMMAIILITLFGLGAWGVLRTWRGAVMTQLKLDTCIAKVTIQFQDQMAAIHQENVAIQVTRAAIVSAIVAPEAIPALKATLESLVAIQNLQLLKWRVLQARWLTGRNCGKGALPLPLPSLKWARLPPDPLGAQPLTWQGSLPENFHFEVTYGNRAAAAQALLHSPGKIDLKWTPPKTQSLLLLRANLN